MYFVRVICSAIITLLFFVCVPVTSAKMTRDRAPLGSSVRCPFDAEIENHMNNTMSKVSLFLSR